MKRKQTRQWLSILLTLILIFSSTAIPSVATNSVTNNDFGIAGDIEAPQGAITASEVVSSDNVTLEENTNLYSKTKRNDDGTYTLELFDFPVKYVDSTGKITEKTLELKDTASAYVTRQSDISCLFPKDLSAGISLTYGDTIVTMVPDIAKTVVKTQCEDGVVSYLASDKTLYRYSLTYMGYKEDIVVPAYTGQTEYQFTYYTNGLHMEILNDELVLTDEGDNAVAGFSEVIVFTADDRNNAFGEYRCETVKVNEEYRVTIVLDADYLKDEKTAYPIVIDPSLEINYDDGASAIEDATINSGTTTAPNGTSIFVGLRSEKGIARLLVKFPGYDFSQLDPSYQILSAQYILRDLMCYSTHLPVEAHVFNSSWNESTVSWTSTLPNNYNLAVLDTQTIFYRNGNYLPDGSTYSNTYAFDITEAVQGWMGGKYDQDAGIMFKTTTAIEAGSEYISVCFASFERSSNKPRLVVNYSINSFLASANYSIIPDGTYFLKNRLNSKVMDIEGPSYADGAYIQVWNFTTTANQKKWTIELQEDGWYTIKSVFSGKYVGVDTISPSVNASIRQYSNGNQSRTRWRFYLDSTGAYYLIPQCAVGTGLVLTLPASSTGNGANLTLQSGSTTTAGAGQKWTCSALLEGVPTHLVSTSPSPLCIPCAITNVAGYWSTHGYSGFNCSTDATQEAAADRVQLAMNNNGTNNGHMANNNIPLGFDVFSYTSGDTTYLFSSINYWRDRVGEGFSWNDLVDDINAGYPLMLGFAAGSPYNGGHMTVCAGYEILNDKLYVYVSDAWGSFTYTRQEFRLDTYSDFICKVRIVELISV